MIGWIAMAVAAAQAATPLVCPARHRGRTLDAITVYDGPVEDMASLVPDRSRQARGVLTQRWDVAGIYRAGRVLTVECGYRGVAPLRLTSSRPLRTCEASWSKAGNSLSCR